MKTHNINKALQLEERSTVQSIMASTDINKAASLSATDALKLISPFFPQEWALTAPTSIRITKLTNGLMNTLHHIHRTNASNFEPASLLIRHFGLEGNSKEPTGTIIDLSAAQQAVVYWEMSRRGWGPKIYGFFAGGRLEDFVEGSHTLIAAESTTDPVRRDVARAYARLHSLQLPLRKDSFATVVRELSESAESKREDVLQTFSDSLLGFVRAIGSDRHGLSTQASAVHVLEEKDAAIWNASEQVGELAVFELRITEAEHIDW